MRRSDVTAQPSNFAARRQVYFSWLRDFPKKFSKTKKHSRTVIRLYGCGRIWGCSSLRQKKPRGSSRGACWHASFSGALVQKTWCRGETTRTDNRVSTVFERHPLRLSFL